MKTIETRADIKLLVDTFYEKVQADDLLSQVFNQAIRGNWDKHLEKMYRFWQTVLFAESAYKGHPLLPHIPLAINQRHFDRWLLLFHETLAKLFEGEKAEEAKWRSTRMAELFQQKLGYYHNHSTKSVQ